MFVIRTGMGNVLYWKQRLGLTANGLSPLPALLEDFNGEAAPDQSAQLAGVSEEELGRALAILWKPQRRLTVRSGGNLLAPEQMLVHCAPEQDPDGLAMVTAAPFDTVIVQYFASAPEWSQWVAQMVDPAGLAQPGETVATGSMNYAQLLHLLHTADMYRRLYYESTLDYIPASEFVFSPVRYAQALRDAVSSGDYRWLVPCLLLMLPQGLPLDPERVASQFAAMREWGLLVRDQGDDDYEAYAFTPQGVNWGLEFMTRWVSALGISVTDVEGSRGEHGLFFLGTTLTVHSFAFQGLGRDVLIKHAGMGGKETAQMAERLLNGELLTPVISADICPACRQPIQAGDRFCSGCGTHIE